MAKKRAKAKPAKKVARKKGAKPARARKKPAPRAKTARKSTTRAAVPKALESLGAGALDLLRAWSPSRYSSR